MRQTMVLVWKEWREHRWSLCGGLAVFLVCPLFALAGYLMNGHGAYSQSYFPEAMILGLGWLLAIVVGVGATCRDFSDRLQCFWQSRPVRLSQWLAVKYVVGLAVVLLVCLVPVALEMGFAVLCHQRTWWEDKYTQSVLYCATFTVMLLFSVGFLFGCLVRRAAQAAILSVTVGLFVYFLPVLVPPLACLGVINVMQDVFWETRSGSFDSRYISFVLAMLTGSGLAFFLSGLAVKCDWRVQVDKRVVIVTLGTVFLLLGSATAFQVGTNLTCLEWRQVDPPNRPARDERSIWRIVTSGRRGVLVLDNRRLGWIPGSTTLTLCRFDLSAPEPGFGNETPLNGECSDHGIDNTGEAVVVWSETHADRAYFLWTNEKWNGSVRWQGDPILMTLATDAPPDRVLIHKLDLSSYGDGSQMCEYKGRLYFACNRSVQEPPRILVIDVSHPDVPRVAEVVESPGRFGVRSRGNAYEADYEITGIVLPRIKELSGQERLELAVRLTLDWAVPPMAFSDGLLVVADGGGLSTFRMTGIEGDLAKLKRVGRYRQTLLEEALMRQAYRVALSHGLAYTLDQHGLTVYDVRRPEYPRRVGHYASSADWFGDVVPLPDGRVLVGGHKLHVLAPPKVD